MGIRRVRLDQHRREDELFLWEIQSLPEAWGGVGVEGCSGCNVARTQRRRQHWVGPMCDWTDYPALITKAWL